MQRERLDVRKVFAALRAAETHLKTIFGATAIHQSQSEEFKGSREALSSGILNAANHDRLTLGQSKHNTSANQNKGTRLGGPSDSSRGNMPTRRKASSLNLPAALILGRRSSFVVRCSLFVVRCSLFVARCVSSLFVVRCSSFVVRCSFCVVLCLLFVVASLFVARCV